MPYRETLEIKSVWNKFKYRYSIDVISTTGKTFTETG
jgi:hypothetical protein